MGALKYLLDTVVVLFLFSAGFSACNYLSQVHCVEREEFELIHSVEESYLIDTGSTVYPSAAYFITSANRDSSFLCIDNLAQNRIDIFDFKTKQHHHRIQLRGEGPNGIKFKPTSFFAQSLDSIFLFFNIGQELLLLNYNGEVTKRFGRINPEWSKDNHIPILQINGQMKPFMLDDRLYFCTYGQPYTSGQSGATFDLNEGDMVSYLYPTSPVYSNGWWIGLLYDKFYLTYNPNEKLFILSYGADGNIYTVDEYGKRNAYCAKSKHLAYPLRPYSKEELDFESNYQAYWKHEALQGGYASLLFDPWRHMYYRIAFKPHDDATYKSPQQLWDRPTIILLDKNLNKIGETDLPEGYLFTISFISPEGLHFFNKKAYDEKDENNIRFGIFKPVKREK